jgi:hypothetical protein
VSELKGLIGRALRSHIKVSYYMEEGVKIIELSRGGVSITIPKQRINETSLLNAIYFLENFAKM